MIKIYPDYFATTYEEMAAIIGILGWAGENELLVDLEIGGGTT